MAAPSRSAVVQPEQGGWLLAIPSLPTATPMAGRKRRAAHRAAARSAGPWMGTTEARGRRRCWRLSPSAMSSALFSRDEDPNAQSFFKTFSPDTAADCCSDCRIHGRNRPRHGLSRRDRHSVAGRMGQRAADDHAALGPDHRVCRDGRHRGGSAGPDPRLHRQQPELVASCARAGGSSHLCRRPARPRGLRRAGVLLHSPGFQP